MTTILLPAPFEGISITPFRPTDAARMETFLNDPSVYPFLNGPPYPYTLEMAEWWISHQEERFESGEELRGPTAIRSPDGAYIGSICLASNPLNQIRDPNLRARKVAENRERPVAGKGIGRSWAFGFYLSPDVVGRGLMTAIVEAYLKYAVQDRGLHWSQINCSALTTNPASLKVQLKAGFQLRYISRDAITFPASKGGGQTDLWTTVYFPEGSDEDELDAGIWEGEDHERIDVGDVFP